MKASKTGFGLLLATIALFALPSGAVAEYLVPPGNSAATQYTEAVPTAGGPKATNPAGKDGGKAPQQVLGHGNAAKLEARGPEGRAAAEVAAETAPGTVTAGTAGASQGAGAKGSGQQASPNGSDGAPGPGSKGHDSIGDKTAGSAASGQQAPSASSASDGSSALGEVIGQATGASDSGQLGLLLPLIVLAALAWSVAFVLRQRKRPTE